MAIRIVNNWRVSLKRPYYAVVNGQALYDSKGVLRKFASQDAAQKAAEKYLNTTPVVSAVLPCSSPAI